MGDHVRREEQDGVLRLVIDRPAKKNALDLAMYRDLTSALADAVERDDLRVVVLTGAGGCFTAGNDLADFADPSADLSAVLAFLEALRTFPKPLVAAVDGLAIGIGTTALLHADLVFASDRARFKLPFVDLGLVPEAGSSFVLPRLMGHAKAARWLLLGELFGAGDAEAMGIVGQVVTADDLDAAAMKAASVLAAKPPHALAKTKALMRRWDEDTLHEAMTEEAAVFQACLVGDEARAAFAAFFRR